jgi:hypothetical protein
MSRLAQLKPLISALPPTPLRPAGSPQLGSALTSIAGRIDAKSTPEQAEVVFKGMQATLERIARGDAMAQVGSCLLAYRQLGATQG